MGSFDIMYISWNIDVFIQLVPSFIVTSLLVECGFLISGRSWLFLFGAAGLPEAAVF